MLKSQALAAGIEGREDIAEGFHIAQGFCDGFGQFDLNL